MIRIRYKATAKALCVLSLLWILQGCAQVATQSPPIPVERPPQVESPPSVETESPAEIEPPGSVPPEVPGEVEAASVRPELLFHVHVVRWQGETLPLIAEWYTASRHHSGEIEKANPGIDPKRITPGNTILIPASLLKQRTPMPFDFLPPPPSRKKSVPPLTARIPPKKREEATIREPAKATGTPTALAEETELFGPREATTAPATIPDELELFGPGEIAGSPATAEKVELFGPVE